MTISGLTLVCIALAPALGVFIGFAIGWYGRSCHPKRTLHLVFDRMPDHDGANFIEAEDAAGRSVRAGTWMARSDGLAELVIKL